ncbi:MAG: ANTAR domain-containing response regulator [Gemmatimonadota bacterium]
MATLAILVAEDEPLTAMALEAQIVALGHRIVGPARTGDEAVRLTREQPIDVAIIDLGMSRRAGLDTAERIVRIRPVPVIVLAEYGESARSGREVGAPVFHHLVKPVSTEELLPAISVARRRFEEWTELTTQVERLERELDERKALERAKGLIMEERGVSAAQADRILAEEGERRGEGPGEIARMIIAANELLRGTPSA